MKAIRKYAIIARINLINAFAYRAQVVSGLLFYTLFIFVFFSLWGAIYQGGEVHGYTHAQVVWYLIATELIVFGCRVSDVVHQVSQDVKTGDLAYMLSRPMSYIGFQAASALGKILVNLLFFGTLAAVLGFAFVGPVPEFQWRAIPMMLLSGALGVALQFFLLLSIGLTAFRLEDNTAIFLIYQKLVFMLGVFLPVEFLPDWLQGVARLLPFSYVAWAPARLFVAFSWELFGQIMPMQLIWTASAVALATSLYRSGVKALTAHGG